MSRAKAAAERAPLDFYGTPLPLAHAICRYLSVQEGIPALIVEPSAGHGPFVIHAREEWHHHAPITAVDVDPAKVDHLLRAGADTVVEADWCRYAPMLDHPDGRVFIIGNPPYSEAEEHIRAALAYMQPDDVLAFLLRINFLGSLARLRFWEENPARYIVPLAPRPSFTGHGKTDGTEYALFVWQGTQHAPPPTQLRAPLRWI